MPVTGTASGSAMSRIGANVMMAGAIAAPTTQTMTMERRRLSRPEAAIADATPIAKPHLLRTAT